MWVSGSGPAWQVGNTPPPPPPPTHGRKTPETWETHQTRGKPTEHKIPSDGADLRGMEGACSRH